MTEKPIAEEDNASNVAKDLPHMNVLKILDYQLSKKMAALNPLTGKRLGMEFLKPAKNVQ